MTISGEVTLNGVTGKAMMEIIKEIDTGSHSVTFKPQTSVSSVPGEGRDPTVFNAVTLTWNTPAGLRAIGVLFQNIAGPGP